METAIHAHDFMTSQPVRAEAFRVAGIAKPQKAFAVAFAVLAAALAGCASGLGAHHQTSFDQVARVEEGSVVGVRAISAGQSAYTVRLPSGELVSVAQTGDYAIPAGAAVLVEYGAQARVVPQRMS